MTSTTSRPFIVELVGPAGVGKTTLSQILAGTWIGGASTIWGQPRKMLLTTGIESFPSFVPLWRLAGSSLWNGITPMVRLRTVERSISAEHGTDTLVFDEGPVFALTWLRGFGHPVMRSLAADQWWQTTLRSWARLIDVV